jgi:hypothetical protein
VPNKIKPKRSYTANAVPTTSDLDANELAINWADGKAFTKTAAGNIVSITLGGSGGGGGAVEDSLLRSIFVPPAPTGLTAVPGNASASLLWTAPTGVIAQAPITDYREQYSTDGGTTWTTFTAAASTATTATVTGLQNNTAVSFRVAAVNAVGVGAYTAASAAVTPAAGDPLFANVALLLKMDGTGNTFVDSSATPKSITAVGNATQSTAQSKFGGKSAAFDGSGDYLTIPQIAFGTSDFVVECWLYFNSISGDYTGIYDGRPGVNGNYPALLLNGTSISWYTFNSFNITGPSLSPGQWYHVAVARASGSTRMYVDGTQVGSTYSDSTNYAASATTFIGNGSGGFFINGYIDDLRITVGSARGYTGPTITVPTAAFQEAVPGTDPLFSSVSLLLHADGTGSTFVDSSATPKTITAVGNATQSAAQSKFGGKSGLFDGSGDYLTAGSIPLSTSDFVIEGWFYLTSSPPSGTFTTLFAHRANLASTGGACLVMDGSSLLYFIAGTSNWQVVGSPTGLSVSENTWMHIALVRSGNQCRVYLNGTGGNVASVSGAIGTNGSFSIMAGAADGGQAVAGYCDDFRVTVGNNRGYTVATIPVPLAAFPNSA